MLARASSLVTNYCQASGLLGQRPKDKNHEAGASRYLIFDTYLFFTSP